MIRQEIIKLTQKAVASAGFRTPATVRVEHPEGEGHGDYATSIALQLAKNFKLSPKNIAINLKSHILRTQSGLLEKVEVAEPGFINFFLSKEYLQKQVGEILKQKENFGRLKIGKNKKVQVEFISANPTGPLTVGNARGGPLGDVLANVLEKAGYKVSREYYVNDTGRQIELLKDSLAGKDGYKNPYVDELKKNKVKDIKEAVKFIVAKIKQTTERMNIKFDQWFYESELHRKKEIDQVIGFLKKQGLVYEKEGAQWFKSSKYGDERDRVIIKADGSKTYLAGDMAYHRYKFEKKKFAKAINVWGADHYGDVPGLQAGVEALGHKGRLDFILLQFVTLIEGGKGLKMSKRQGIYVSMDELLDAVGSDVARFFFLQKSANTHLNFDLSLAKEQSDKNPVYYAQYAHARICSILKKSQIPNPKSQNLKLLNHSSELNLVKQLIRFPEAVEDIAKDYQVQRLPQYAMDLATAFHQFYRDCRVISENKKLTQARIGLVLAAKIILKNSLFLMGISAPEKM